MNRIILAIIAFILGIIPGFFIVFNSVFTDSNRSLSERLFTFMLVVVVYGLASYVLGMFEKSKSRWVWISLSAPAVIILVLYSLKETTNLGLQLFYACLTVGSSWFGSFAGKGFGSKRN